MLCINNFLQKAFTPVLSSFGFNCEYTGNDGGKFSDIIDNMSDNDALIEHGYEIKSTTISRTLVGGAHLLNFQASLNENELKLHFNQHCNHHNSDMPALTVKQIEDFLFSAKEIVKSLDYEIEEES